MKHEFKIYNLKFIILLFTFYFLLSPAARAENLSSDSYRIDMGNLNMGAGLPSSSSYKLGVTGGQTAPGLYTSTGYKVKAGFWYIKSIIPFSFTISDLSIDFGSLSTNTLTDKTNTLTLSSGGAGGYQVTAQENKPLSSQTAAISDTTCDDGTCTESLCRPWTQTNKYGFGFNMSGDDVDTSDTKFKNNTYFCQFADQSTSPSETPQIVMSKSGVTSRSTATVTYRVNISGSQAAGDYENYIVFVATPSY